MNRKNYGEIVLSRMYRRSFCLNFLGSVTVMINTVVDGMITGHYLGPGAVAAFGLIVPLYSLMNLIPILLGASARIRIGSLIGKGDIKGAGSAIKSLMIRGVIAAIPLFLIFGFFAKDLFLLLGIGGEISEDLLPMVSDYLLAFSPTLFPIMISPILHPLMIFDGDGKRSPIAIACATGVNIVADILNARLFGGGMTGMALATTLSCYVECAVLLAHFFRKGAKIRPFENAASDPELGKAMVSAAPVMIRELTAFFAGTAMNIIAYTLGGESTLSAFSVGNSLWPLLCTFGTAVGSTGLELGNVSMGERDYHGVASVFRRGIWYCLVPGTVFAIIFGLLSNLFASYSSANDPLIMMMSERYLHALAAALPFAALCQDIESHLMVQKRTMAAAAVGIANGGAAAMCAAFIMSRLIGTDGLFTARAVASLFIVAAAGGAIFLTGEKKKSADNPVHGDQGEIMEVDTTVFSIDDVIGFSEQVRIACKERKIDKRIGNLAALCIEEMGGNIIRWGYKNGRDLGADLRVVIEKEKMTIRFRDKGVRFDPGQYIRQFEEMPHDPAGNFGLRMMSGLVDDMRYICLADCNVCIITIPLGLYPGIISAGYGKT